MDMLSRKTNAWLMVLLFLVGVTAALYGLCWAKPTIAEWIVHKTGYYFAGVSFIAFIYTAFRVVRIELPPKWHLTLLATAVASSSVILFQHEELGPKIAMDDYVLSSTAKSMSEEREVEVLTLGRNFNGYFIRADAYVDKRPWLYPFVVSLAHDLSGFRIDNAFIVNACFAIILLILTVAFGYKLGGLPAGLFGPLLWATLPLLSQNALGGGLDMLNLLMLQVVLLSALYYIQKPDSDRLSLLCLGMVLLSYTRYESIIFWGPVALIIVMGWFRAKRVIVSIAMAAVPLLLTGLAALQNYIETNPSLWELPDDLSKRFGVEYMIPNFQSALYYLLNFGDELSNSVLLALAGIPCAILFVLSTVKSIQARDTGYYQKTVCLLFTLGILGHFFIIMSYHDGQLDEKISSRFALPLYLLLVTCILSVLAERVKRPQSWCIAALIVGVFTIGVTLPNKAKGIYSKRNFVVREAEWLESQANRFFEPMSLVVDPQTVVWTLKEWHCISAVEAVANRPRVYSESKRGKFPEIYLVDRLSAVYDPDNRIGFESDYDYSGFEAVLIAERSFSPLRMTRIYRVTEIDTEDANKLNATSAPSAMGQVKVSFEQDKNSILK